MRRVVIVLDVTDAEADHIAAALVDVSPELQGKGIKECLSDARAFGKDKAGDLLVQLRSGASAALGGSDAIIARSDQS